MRILIFNWRDARHPEAGGAETFLHETATRWVKGGHQVALICGNPSGGPRVEDWYEGVKVIRVGGRYSVYPAAAAEYVQRWRGWPHAVIEHIHGVPFYTPVYVDEPVVAVIHHLVGRIFLQELGFPLSFLGLGAERTLPIVYGRTPVVTVSPSSRRELLRMGFDSSLVSIIYNGVDQPRVPVTAEREEDLILYLGRLKRYKRLDLLVEAGRLVLREVPSATFVIAGRGDYESRLRKLIQRAGLEESFQLVGYVSEEEKRDLLGRARLLVLTSEKEGWGLTVIEAAAHGTPSIAFDAPGIRDAIRHGETGFLVPERDPLHLAREIIGLLRDEDRRRRLGEAAASHAKGFRWRRAADSLLEMLTR